MQIPAQDLSKHLARGLRPLYTLHGDEPLQQMEALEAIRAVALTQGFGERQSFTVSGQHFDWSSVQAAASAMSLFADRQFIELRIPSGKPGKEGSVALQELAASLADQDGVMVVVLLPRLDRATKSTAWFAALDAHGAHLQLDPIERHALPAWIAHRLAAQGQRVEPGVAGERCLQFFADRVEGNLLAAHQEVVKLGLLYPQGELSHAQIEQAVLNVARYDVFKLTEAVLAGQVDRTQRMLDGLRAEGEAEVLVHHTLAEEIRCLWRVHRAVLAGRDVRAVLQQERVWGPREKQYIRIVPQLKRQTVEHLLQWAHRVDGIVKGLLVDDWPRDGWLALHRLAFRMAHICRPR